MKTASTIYLLEDVFVPSVEAEILSMSSAIHRKQHGNRDGKILSMKRNLKLVYLGRSNALRKMVEKTGSNSTKKLHVVLITLGIIH